jgi:hypothetical protein
MTILDLFDGIPEEDGLSVVQLALKHEDDNR